ncbi:prolyl oligopeptidase family serine peptidase [Paenibacillus sp. CC-CFT747]|nr:prolyl oligopeptidase family serine peptidase [Paenibacillus sp. CC-CFT747]
MNLSQLENYFVDYDVNDELKQHVYGRSIEAFARGDQARDAIVNRDQLEARRTHLRGKFMEAIGGIPACDTALNPRTTGRVQGEGFSIEKIMFESRPQTYVTANLYIPDSLDSPRGAVLFLCGHDREAKHSEEYQTVCRILVHSGLVVLAIDPIGQGERFSYYEADAGELTVADGIIEHEYAGMQCLPLGDGLARYFLHDAMRAIDYLTTRPEVDPARIGVTGNSGGGTQTSMLMLADPRLAAAAPGTFIMSRQSYLITGQAQDAEQVWFGMSAAGLDHEDILLAMAPRPVLVLAVTNDFFLLKARIEPSSGPNDSGRCMAAETSLRLLKTIPSISIRCRWQQRQRSFSANTCWSVLQSVRVERLNYWSNVRSGVRRVGK